MGLSRVRSAGLSSQLMSTLSPACSLTDAVFSSTNTCHCRETTRRSRKPTAKTGGRGRGPQQGLPTRGLGCPRGAPCGQRGEAERLGALSSYSITGDLPCPHLLGRALRTGKLCEFPGVTRHPQRSQSVLCLLGPPHPLKLRIQATGGERAPVPVELWNPRRGRGTKSGSISI